MDEIATIVSEEVGMPKTLSQIIQVGLPMASFANNAALMMHMGEGNWCMARKGEPVPLLHRALSFVACHAAIKAHAPLQREEMARLIADLAITQTPYFCPHGRPIVSRLSLRDIKRELGRTW